MTRKKRKNKKQWSKRKEKIQEHALKVTGLSLSQLIK
jgi:hypothetical protein